MKTISGFGRRLWLKKRAVGLRAAWAVRVLALPLLLLTLPAVVEAQSYTNNYGIWTYTNANGTTTITGYSGPGGAVTIPSEINDLPVTSIGASAFYECRFLTSVTIPDSVTSIGDYAFYACSMSSITIPNSVISIGDWAFYECNLAGVTIGSGVKTIGDWAFGYCSLITLTIPNSVTSIGDWAFGDCWDLTTVTIGNGVTNIGTSIGAASFVECESLTSVTIGAGVTNIGDQVFLDCLNLTNITVDTRNPAYCDVDGVLFNKSLTTLVECPGRLAGAYTIPNGVSSIEDFAFYECVGLTSVSIPDSVTNIGSYAFWHCSGLTNVTIGDNVTNIGEEAFSNCFGLTSVIIPDSVITIGASAFFTCNNLSSVRIGKSVTSIGDYAFQGCPGLSSVTIGSGVTNIGAGAFFSSKNLSSVYFEGNAPSLGSDVFDGDTNATVYYLPGTTGWGAPFGVSTVLWNPEVQPGSFAVRTNQFGFNITGSSNLVVVIQATTSLANPTWSPLQTNTLNGSPLYFSDPQWTNYPSRFYRVTWP